MAIDLNAAAKEIAEKVAANAGVSPELCFAPILFGLQELLAIPDESKLSTWATIIKWIRRDLALNDRLLWIAMALVFACWLIPFIIHVSRGTP